MNCLHDYIIERIRIDNIKLRKFPFDGCIEDIEDFLKDNGFTQIKSNDDTYTGRGNFLNSKHGKYYIIYTNSLNYKSISFADTSNGPISKTNPMYYAKPAADSYRKLVGVGVGLSDILELSLNEFKKEMENYFG
jgi:hypothetical protein